MTSVACIGDVSVDLYLTNACRYVGGISFNVSWNLRDCGVEAQLFSAVGSDEEGAAVMSTLNALGYPTTGIAVREGLTAQQRIVVTPSGERIFDGYRIGVLSTLCLRDVLSAHLERFDALHIPLSDGLEALFNSCAHEVQGIIKIADLSVDAATNQSLNESLARYAEYFDLMFVGGSPDNISYVQKLAKTLPHKVFVITLGGEGAVCFCGDAEYQQKAVAVQHVADTTGCGDGFQGAFIAHWLANRNDISGALEAGVAQGAKIATFVGATPCIIADSQEGF